ARRAFDGLAAAPHGLTVALHLELLEIGREAVQVIVIRQNRVARRAEEVAIPDADEREHHRQVLRERRTREVLVDRMAAREEALERRPADRERDGEPHGRPYGVPA